jgi:type IV secretory pathway VirB10-like protein
MRRVRGLLLAVVLAVAVPGCAAIESLFSPSPPPPAPPAAPATAPSLPPTVYPPPPAPPVAAPPPPAPPLAAPPPVGPPPAAPPRPAVPPATAYPSPRPLPAPLPPLQPQLSEAEERRLQEQTSRQIADAERAARAVRADGLGPDQRDSYGSVQNFLREAVEAFAARDYERARMLARKAETLAKDLPRASR